MTLHWGGKSLSSRFIWRKVWAGVRCNFPCARLNESYVIEELSLSRNRKWNFTRIGRMTKTRWLSIIPARRRSYQPGCHNTKKVLTTTFLGRTKMSRTSLKSSRYWKLKFSVSAGWAKRWPNYSSLKNYFFCSTDGLSCASRGIDNLSVSQLHMPYVYGKLSISWAEICIFQHN